MASAESQARRPPSGGPRQCLLVVDDDTNFGSTIERILRPMDVTVHVVAHADVDRFCDQFTPDIALLRVDQSLPSVADTCRRIKACHQGARLVAVVSPNAPEQKQILEAAGFDATVTVPSAGSSFVATICDLLDQDSPQAALSAQSTGSIGGGERLGR